MSFTENLYLKRAIQKLVEENNYLKYLLEAPEREFRSGPKTVPAPNPTGKNTMSWSPERGVETGPGVNPSAMQFTRDEEEGFKRSGTYPGQHPVTDPSAPGHSYPRVAGQAASGAGMTRMDPAELARKRAQIDADSAALFARELGDRSGGQPQASAQQSQKAARVQRGIQAQQQAGEQMAGKFFGAVERIGQEAGRIAGEAQSRERAAAARAAQVDPERSRMAQERRVADANRSRQAAFDAAVARGETGRVGLDQAAQASRAAQVDPERSRMAQERRVADANRSRQQAFDAAVARGETGRVGLDQAAQASRQAQVDPERSRMAQERRVADANRSRQQAFDAAVARGETKGVSPRRGGVDTLVQQADDIISRTNRAGRETVKTPEGKNLTILPAQRRSGAKQMPAPHPTGKDTMSWSAERGVEKGPGVKQSPMQFTRDEADAFKRSGTYPGQHTVTDPSAPGHSYRSR
jgi:hypothetical protein